MLQSCKERERKINASPFHRHWDVLCFMLLWLRGTNGCPIQSGKWCNRLSWIKIDSYKGRRSPLDILTAHYSSLILNLFKRALFKSAFKLRCKCQTAPADLFLLLLLFCSKQTVRTTGWIVWCSWGTWSGWSPQEYHAGTLDRSLSGTRSAPPP